jgi:hypothetical protein
LLQNGCFSSQAFLADLRLELAMLALHLQHDIGVGVLRA